MWRSWLVFLLLAVPAVAQEELTAYEALKTIGTQMNRAYMSSVLSVTGVDGDPQPQSWRVLVQDRAAGGAREIVVEGGQIASDTPVSGSGPSAAIDTTRLNLDSSGAFSVANHTADKSHTNFALVNYQLRPDERGVPVWAVTLLDERRAPVGTVHISANRGNITRVEGMYAGANMANVEQDPVRRGSRENEEVESDPGDDPEEDDGDVNPVKKEIKRMFHRTKRDAERMFQRVRRPFEDFFNR